MHKIAEPNEWELLKANRLWNRMTFEVSLMTTRLAWLVSAQGILFASFFVGIYSLESQKLEHGLILAIIPMAGLLLSFIMLLYVMAATTIVSVCRSELAILKQKYPIVLSDHIDIANSIEHVRVKHWIKVASRSNYALIAIFAIFWIYVPLIIFMID